MRLKYLIAPLVLLALGACTSSNPNSWNRKPASEALEDGLTWLSQGENEKLWTQYCSAPGGSYLGETPTPNYKNALVQQAVKSLSVVAPNSLYLYPAIVNAYGLKNVTPPAGIKKETHVFLSYLCGEFRDRATMVQAKLKWLSRFYKLKDEKQQPINPADENVWAKMSANSYPLFLEYSRSLWQARAQVTGQISLRESYSEQAAVYGMSVCETKFIFNQISKNLPFEDLSSFNANYMDYSKNCTTADIEDYYDFRGDSNFKPNSPESNGMIWYANHIASNCASTQKANKPDSSEVITNPNNKITDDVCKDYFRNPFRRRWQAARSGLATWMMHSAQYAAQFDNDYSPVLVWPHHLTENRSSVRPFAYKVPQSDGNMTAPLTDWLVGFDSNHMDLVDFNYNSIFGLGEQNEKSKGLAFEAWQGLRNAVNRHTNWYQSQWDDGLGGKNSYKTQAYSPFVASSYEPSESDQFTFCGITVPCPPDGFKHWMFVFRIKGKNWYSIDNLAMHKKAEQRIDFSNQWFDETSLGTTGLADKEHAWDRMGTALEQELAGGAILYLHNITSSGQISNDNLN